MTETLEPAAQSRGVPAALPSGALGRREAGSKGHADLVFGKHRICLQRRKLFRGKKAIGLGARAFEVLKTIVEAEGNLVTKEDLRQRVWPRLVTEDHTIQVQISIIRKALGSDRDLIRTEAGRGYRVTAPVDKIFGGCDSSGIDSASLAAQRNPAPYTNLPAPLSPLVGRERELAELQTLVTEHRLVTLTGIGGIGKTRLALAAAQKLLSSFADGAWIVEFSSLTDPEHAPAVIARALKIKLNSDGDPADQLVAALQHKHLLLVLDNCEHVIDAAAPLVDKLLQGASRLNILTTSQEVLATEGERAYYVAPLAVPPADLSKASEAIKHSAVELFVQRAQAAHPSFLLDDHNAGKVIDICRHLDGLPLAIELAAARVAAMGVGEVAARLTDRFRFLKGGRRALRRHQTLRAALDWSYGLLAEADRIALRRLSIFAGSFTLEGAMAVAADDTVDEYQIADQVTGLVSKSLVILDTREPVSRYRLLETTHAYAREKLVEADEGASVLRRHADYYRKLLAQAETQWQTTPAAELATIYAPELDNIRLALNWAFEPGGDPETGIAIVSAAIPLWTQLSILTEHQHFIHLALSYLNTNDEGYARHEILLQAALGKSSQWAEDVTIEAQSAMTRTLDLAERIGDTEYQLRALFMLWFHHLRRGEYRATLAIAEKFKHIADKENDLPAVITAARLEGTALFYFGDNYEKVKSTLSRVLEHNSLDQDYAAIRHSSIVRFGIDQHIPAQACMARVLWLQGFPDRAMRVAEANVEQARSLNHVNSLCLSLSLGTCYVAALSEDLPALEKFAPALISLADKHALGMWQSDCLIFRGWIAIRRGDVANGLRFLTMAVGDFQQATVELHQTIVAGTLAQALADAGRVDDGLAVINKALEASIRCEGHWCLPELLRIKAALTLQQGLLSARNAAEKDLLEALRLADRQGAKSWQLRIATDLARLWHSQNRTSEARETLMPIYDWFTEGFETADFKAATALVESLR